MENQINVTVDKGIKTLEIRHGQALPLKEPVSISIAGNIDTVSGFLDKRISKLDQLECKIEVDREKQIVLLVINEQSAYMGSVKGQLKHTEVFSRFGINTGTERTTFELADFIKMNRAYFEKPSDAARLVMELNNFKAKIEKDIEQADDRRGNRTAMVRQAVQSNIPEKFNLCLPIFKGEPKAAFEVEVYITPEFNCQLISPAAQEYIETIVNDVVDTELERIVTIAPDIVIIEK